MARDELLDPTPSLSEGNEAEPSRANRTEPAGTNAEDPPAGPVLSLRPRNLHEFIGQSEIKARLGVILEAARRRGQPPDHFLFAGPPGLGKTSLAGIVAAEMDAELQITSGPALERPGDLAAILTKLGEGDVLFIDEIHRLSRSVEEVLYPALEDFELDIVLGKGPAARSIRLDLPRFCLVGATTRTGLITGPLRDRFGMVARLEYYETDDLCSIVVRAAEIIGADIDSEGADEIAGRSRGTPRIANRLLRRVRDVAEVQGDGSIGAAEAREGLELFGIDDKGLDKVDRSILKAICEHFGGGPVGLSTLAIAVSEPTETVEEVYEPYLIQNGLLQRTPRGRMATAAAWRHLGHIPPASSIPAGEAALFDFRE